MPEALQKEQTFFFVKLVLIQRGYHDTNPKGCLSQWKGEEKVMNFLK